MIIVILGGSTSLRDDVVKEFFSHKGSSVQHLNITHCADQAFARLVAECSTRKHKSFITVVTGVSQLKELAFLRQQGAVICHCYGQLSNEYSHIKIEIGDYHILPDILTHTAPEHVYTPLEILSECYFRG